MCVCVCVCVCVFVGVCMTYVEIFLLLGNLSLLTSTKRGEGAPKVDKSVNSYAFTTG